MRYPVLALLLLALMPCHAGRADFVPGEYSDNGVTIKIGASGTVWGVDVAGDGSGFGGHFFAAGGDLQSSGNSLSGSWNDRNVTSLGYIEQECSFSAEFDGSEFRGEYSWSYDANQTGGGYDGSNRAFGDFRIAIPRGVAAPMLSLVSGAYDSTWVTVTVSCATEGATIRYTLDGNEPSESSLAVESGNAVMVPVPGTLKVRAWKTGFVSSPTTSATYRTRVATPTFTPNSGVYSTDSVNVVVRCATLGATIRYTTNGSVPTESSPTVASGGTITVPVPGSLIAKAWKTGIEASLTSEGYYDGMDAMIFTTLAGLAGTSGSTNGTGSLASFSYPEDLAVDAGGNIYVADGNNHAIRKVTPEGVVTTLAGLAGTSGSANGTGSAARFSSPKGVAVDAGGNVYVADWGNHTIRKVTPSGVVTTLAGQAGTPGSANGTGSAARFNYPWGLAVDAGGNVLVADRDNHTIRKVTPSGVVTTLAGLAGTSGSTNGTGSAARFCWPCDVAVDVAGNVYIAEEENCTVRKMTAAGSVTTLAGLAGTPGSANGTGSAARFYSPRGVAVDTTGNVYVADTWNHMIRKVTSAGVVTTLGGRADTFGSTDGIGSAARFRSPEGVAVDANGNVYVGDSRNHTIRQGSLATASSPPVFNPDGGAFAGNSVEVVVTCPTAGVTIHYSIDGSEPTESSATVASGGTVSVPVPGTLKAGAWKAGIPPIATTTADFTVAPLVDTPTFTPDGSDQSGSSVSVTVSCATAGATIRYTTNGNDPTESSATVASGGTVSVPIPGTLKATAWKSGMNPSATKSASYTAAPVVPGALSYAAGGTSFTMWGVDGIVSRSTTVADFYVGQYEVTYSEWVAVKTWANAHGYDLGSAGTASGEDHPVRNLSWYDAVKWCNARSEMEGLTPAYYLDDAHASVYRKGQVNLTHAKVDWDADGYRLPTDAEWQYAAQGGSLTHNWNFSGGNTYDTVGWYDVNSSGAVVSLDAQGRGTWPVGLKTPNELGLYDMSGNVLEWTWDWYADISSTPATDPRGPDTGTLRLIRGGSWDLPDWGGLVWNRHHADPVWRVHWCGFRVVRSRAEAKPPSMPGLAVERPGGVSIPSEGHDFGTLPPAGRETVSFTIRSTGAANLVGIDLQIAGPQAQNFSISPPRLTTLRPGASTTFEVTFHPAAIGNSLATIQVTGSDMQFDFNVVGICSASSTHQLAVTASPPHAGSVAKSPEKSAYVPGETVSLTPTAKPGYVFTGWGGDAIGTASPLQVSMDQAKSITANFAPVGLAEMPLVEGGIPFSMWNWDGTSRQTTLGNFYLGKLEVGWGQWKTVRDWAGTHGYDLAEVGAGSGDSHPVHSVNWYDAVKWCNARSEMEGLTPVYYTSSTHATVYRSGQLSLTSTFVDWNADGYRLPTEAEWHYAAQGGTHLRSYRYSGSDSLDEVGWFVGNSAGAEVDIEDGRGTWPRGQKQANDLGFYDMSGNVLEWTWDRLGKLATKPAVDPRGPDSGNDRMFRGGDWDLEEWICTVNARSSGLPHARMNGVGFRVARSKPAAQSGPVLSVEITKGVPHQNGTAVDFGNLTAGFAAPPKTVTLKNTGKANLLVGPISVTGAAAADFPLVMMRTAAFLKPGQSTSLTVAFTPNLDSDRDAVLEIPTNDPAASPFEIPLHGTANEPGLVVAGGQAVQIPDALDHLGDVKSVTGLPPGIKFDAKTGLLTGRPTTPGAFAAEATVRDPDGKTRTIPFPFIVEALPQWAVGSFTILLTPPSPADASLTGLGGWMSLTSTPSGAFTGSLTLGAKKFAFKGQIDGLLEADRGDDPLCAQATIITNSRDRTQDATLDLEFRPADHAPQPGLTGNLTFRKGQSDEVVLPIQPGWQHVWNTKTNPAFGNKDRTLSVAIENQDAEGPQGDGFATIKLTKDGLATWAATLADGRKVTGSFTASPDSEIPLYAAIPYPGTGTVFALLQTQIADGLLQAQDSAATWIKLPTPARTADRLYRDGFDVNLDISGAEHRATATGHLLFGDQVALPLPLSFDLTGGGLDSCSQLAAQNDSLSWAAELQRANKLVVTQTGLPVKVTPAFSAATGLLSGRISLSDIVDNKKTARTLTYSGLYIPDLATPSNSTIHGFFLLPELPDGNPVGETISNTPVHSGRLEFYPE